MERALSRDNEEPDGQLEIGLPGLRETRERPRAERYGHSVTAELRFDDRLIAELASAEKQVQQSYRPIIGVHKWFARRPGALFRGLLLAEFDDRPLAESYFDSHDLDGVVLDPFMGGGTTIFEANRIGLSTVGYDTNPMSRWVVEREIEPLDVAAFEKAGEEVANAVEAEIGSLYETECDECGDTVPVKFFLWVKTHVCDCGEETLLFPGPLVAGRKMGRHTHDVLVCRHCREVHQYLPDETPEHCPCGKPYADTAVPARSECTCGREMAATPKAAASPPKHTLFALEYHCPTCKTREGRRGRFFKGASLADHARFVRARERCAAITSAHWPDHAIEAGDETNRLLRWGYRTWRDLHNERQLLGLAILAEKILEQPEELRSALATVYSDFIRYQNLICRYDTAALKVLDVFSVHGFPVHRVQCEAALVGIPKIGSGGYRHFLAKYATAKRYCQQPFETVIRNGRKQKLPVVGERIAARTVDDEYALTEKRASLLRCASISVEQLPENSVDVVLTDPPFFSMVQYSELMDFCYAWLRRLVPATPFFTVATAKSADEVTGNVTEGRGLDGFTEGLSGVFRASAKALKPGHLFAFTYHHNDLSSYAALVVAVLDAGLVPVRTIGCPSEMRGSIHIANSNSSRVDTVFLLNKPPAAVSASSRLGVQALLDEQVAHLVEAGLKVTEGDRRCLRFGLIAEKAIRALARAWVTSAPIHDRLDRATAELKRLFADLDAAAVSELEALEHEFKAAEQT